MAIIRRSETAPARAEFDPFRTMQNLLRWDPFRALEPLRPMLAPEVGYAPQFDVKETKDSYIFKADLPGIKEPELEISLSGNVLSISGKREGEEQEEGDTWYAYERHYGSFTRTFTLPESADVDNVKAELREGVLTLVMPKKAEMKAKKIPVSATGGKQQVKS